MFSIQFCHLLLLTSLIIWTVINLSVACNPMQESPRHFDTLEYGVPPRRYIAATTEVCPNYFSSPRYLVPVSENSTRGTCVEQLSFPKRNETTDSKQDLELVQEYVPASIRILRNNCPERRVWSIRLQRCITKLRELIF